MKILLTGSNGFIGRNITAALTSAQHEVIHLSRASGHDYNRMHTATAWIPLLYGIDAVINCVGIITESRTQSFASLHQQAPIALFHACAQLGVKRVIQISALGADLHATTPYFRSKYAADQLLQSLPLEWFVLRPSLVYGPGGKSSAMFTRMAMLPVIPLIDHGHQQIQPVHIDDLVAAVMHCLIDTSTRQVINIVGPEAMSFADWLQRLRNKHSKQKAATLSVPYMPILALSHIGKYLLPIMHPDNLKMLQQGNTADVQPLTDLLGRKPRELP
ncbi:MAG: NAD-dependent epimerase/dehydratase family protein [Gammaproteobacteria bacterium]|nr:NAD-dependent epimerase/dehydratase family protein [Gammaproteobacteria bacterium]